MSFFRSLLEAAMGNEQDTPAGNSSLMEEDNISDFSFDHPMASTSKKMVKKGK
jgi:hypothetical protein